VSRYQKGKTSLDYTEARDTEWQLHQLGRVQVCTSLQTDNHASTPPLSFFTGRMPFHPPNQQHQSTEGKYGHVVHEKRKQTRRYTVKGRHVDYDTPQPSDGGVKLLIYRWNSATTVFLLFSFSVFTHF